VSACSRRRNARRLTSCSRWAGRWPPWTTDNLHLELAQGLTTIENARLEWNSARLKWPVLNKAVETEEDSGDTPTVNTPLFGQQSFGQLCRIGFALNWPSAVLALVILAWLLLNR
jgi:hypothetical protein